MNGTTYPANVKDYLSQAFRLDQCITSKVHQLDELRSLATKATMTLSDMPRPETPNPQSMEDTVIKIVDLSREINDDIDLLVDIKRCMIQAIHLLPQAEHRLVLEHRYLCYKTWEQIAEALHYSVQHIFRLHTQALNNIVLPENLPTCDRMRVRQVVE